MIARGTKAYVMLKEIGELSDAGRKVLSVGYQGKLVATEDTPLSSLVIPLLCDLVPHISYSNRGQFDADVKMLKEAVGRLVFRESAKN